MGIFKRKEKIVLTAEQKKARRKKIAKTTIYNTAVLGLGAFCFYNLATYQEPIAIKDNYVNEAYVDEALNKKSNINRLEKIIKEEEKFLDYVSEADFPDSGNADFKELYKKEMQPLLKYKLQVPHDVPDVKINSGFISGVNDDVTLNVLGLIGAGCLFFGARTYRNGKSFLGNVSDVFRNIYDGVRKRKNPGDALKGVMGGLGQGAKSAMYLGFSAYLLSSVFSMGANMIVGYSNSYNPRTKMANVTPVQIMDIYTDEELAIVAAHEATHYYQDVLDMPYNASLMEGHARMIELQIGEHMFKKTGNGHYLDSSLKREIKELKAVYLDLCGDYGVQPDAKIFSDIVMNDAYLKYNAKVAEDPHAKGTALFMLAEDKYGDSIYRDYRLGNLEKLVKK